MNIGDFGNTKDLCSDGELFVFDDEGNQLSSGGLPCSRWVIMLPGEG